MTSIPTRTLKNYKQLISAEEFLFYLEDPDQNMEQIIMFYNAYYHFANPVIKKFYPHLHEKLNSLAKPFRFTNETLYVATHSFVDDPYTTELTYGPIKTWDTSNVTHMNRLFHDHLYNEGCHFNCNISSWDTSNVESMKNLFEGCYDFNQPLNSWNVSKVKSMRGMFTSCLNFNQPLSDWDTSSVIHMSGMFFGCKTVQDYSMWNVDNVEDVDCSFWWGQYNKIPVEHTPLKFRKPN